MKNDPMQELDVTSHIYLNMTNISKCRWGTKNYLKGLFRQMVFYKFKDIQITPYNLFPVGDYLTGRAHTLSSVGTYLA